MCQQMSDDIQQRIDRLASLQKLHKRLLDSDAFTSGECDKLLELIEVERDALDVVRQRKRDVDPRVEILTRTLRVREEMLSSEADKRIFEFCRAEHERLLGELERLQQA